MSHSLPDRPSWAEAIEARWPGARRRILAIALMLAIELLLLLALLSLGAGQGVLPSVREVVTTFDAREEAAPSPDPEPEAVPEPQSSAPAAASPVEPRPTPLDPEPRAVPPSVPPPPLVLRTTPTPAPPAPAAPATPARSKITAVVRSDMAGQSGPPDTGTPGDSERIEGSGPNGEPLYRARWYREPGDSELRGYLSTATGPGWALINCRTEPEFRVDDCYLVGESPQGSNMGRAVLAAAWQFRVRPPRVGGRSLVGEWVRIRIDYTIRPG